MDQPERAPSACRPERGIREAQSRRGGRFEERRYSDYPDWRSSSARQPSCFAREKEVEMQDDPARMRAREGERVS